MFLHVFLFKLNLLTRLRRPRKNETSGMEIYLIIIIELDSKGDFLK